MAEEIHLGTHRVLGGKFHVVRVFQCQFHRIDRSLHHLFGLHAQLLFHVDGAGGDEGMDAPARMAVLGRRADRLACRAHVALEGACQGTHPGIPDDRGDRPDRFGVTGTGRSKAGLDDIHTQAFQLARDAYLLVLGHGRTRTLLAVAQGGIEYD